MPSTTLDAFWQTLVAESGDPTKVFGESYALTKAVYKDFSPVETNPGLAQTLTIAFPAEVTAVDGQGADPTINEASFTSKSIAYDQNPQWAVVIRDFDQYNSPERVRDLLIDPAVKAIRKHVNDKLWTKAVTTSGNFDTYTGTTYNTTSGKITPAQFLAMVEAMAENKVPTQDGKITLCVAPKVFYGILGDSNWSDFQVAGQLANSIRETGSIPTVYGVEIALDHGAKVSGTPSTRTFTNLMVHQYGLALVTRPMPSPDSNVVKVTNFMADGLPIRATIGYSIQKNGFVLIVEAGYGVGVTRSVAGLVSSTTEA